MENGFAKYPPVHTYLETVKDGYIPPKRVRSAAQKEAKRNNALALEIIQKELSKAMRDKMKTITSAKELLLILEQIYKVDDEEDEEKLLEMLMEADGENKCGSHNSSTPRNQATQTPRNQAT